MSENSFQIFRVDLYLFEVLFYCNLSHRGFIRIYTALRSLLAFVFVKRKLVCEKYINEEIGIILKRET